MRSAASSSRRAPNPTPGPSAGEPHPLQPWPQTQIPKAENRSKRRMRSAADGPRRAPHPTPGPTAGEIHPLPTWPPNVYIYIYISIYVNTYVHTYINLSYIYIYTYIRMYTYMGVTFLLGEATTFLRACSCLPTCLLALACLFACLLLLAYLPACALRRCPTDFLGTVERKSNTRGATYLVVADLVREGGHFPGAPTPSTRKVPRGLLGKSGKQAQHLSGSV